MGKRPTCVVCGERPAVSYATTKCDVCLYREAMGDTAAERQAALAAAEAEKAKARRKAAAKR